MKHEYLFELLGVPVEKIQEFEFKVKRDDICAAYEELYEHTAYERFIFDLNSFLPVGSVEYSLKDDDYFWLIFREENP